MVGDQQQLSVSQVQASPLDYVVPNAQVIELLCANAVFNGAAAASSWLPALVIVSDSGHTVSRSIGTAVAAGGSAEVSFAPFLRAPAASSSGGGIQFDTEPQSGGYLELETTGTDPSYGAGMEFRTADGTLFEVVASDVRVSPPGAASTFKVIDANGNELTVGTDADGVGFFTGSDTLHFATGTGTMRIGWTGSGGEIVFEGGPDFDVRGSFEVSYGFVVDVMPDFQIANPGASQARIAARLNGGGKVELVARFPSGAAVILATEP